MRSAICLLVTSCILVGCPTPEPTVLSFPGDLPTARWDTTFGDGWPLTILFPDTPASQPAPLVVFTVGWNQTRAGYLGYATQLAQWGYVCIIRAYPALELIGLDAGTVEQQCQQIVQLIDWAGAQNEDPDSPLYGRVDADNVGVTGHSFGGKASVASALFDDRIRTVVDIDGNNESADFTLTDKLQDITVPILWIASDSGFRCAELIGPLGENLFPYANAPSLEVTVVGASHIDFLESSQGFNIVGQYICGGGEQDPNLSRSFAYRYMISWFNVYLKGEKDFQDYFLGVHAEEDVAAGSVIIRATLPDETGGQTTEVLFNEYATAP